MLLQAHHRDSTPSSSSETPSISSTNTRRPRFRKLSEIYEQKECDNSAGLNSLFALFFHVDDPIHFEDAVKEEKWIEAMNKEIGAIENNDTWELVEIPQGKEVIGVKWVYKTKRNIEAKIERQKERLVVKGYKQHQGRDYEETFAPIARM